MTTYTFPTYAAARTFIRRMEDNGKLTGRPRSTAPYTVLVLEQDVETAGHVLRTMRSYQAMMSAIGRVEVRS